MAPWIESGRSEIHVFGCFLNRGRETALQQLSELQAAPSVALHDVPRESVGQHLGLMTDDETLSRDELDDKLARKFADSNRQ
jgi:histone deacetylase 1/2